MYSQGRKHRLLIIGIFVGFILGVSIPIAQSMAVIGIDFATACPSGPQQFAVNETAAGSFQCSRVPYSSLTGTPTINNETASNCGSSKVAQNETIAGVLQCNYPSALKGNYPYGNLSGFPSGSACAAYGYFAYKINSTNYYCSQVPDNSGIFFSHLFQYLPLDDNTLTNWGANHIAHDLSDDGWFGTVHGSVSAGNFRKCIYVSCLQFDGSSGYLQVSSATVVISFSQGYTFTTWFNATSLSSTEQAILSDATSNGKNGITIGYNNAGFNVTMGDGTTAFNYRAAYAINVNHYYLLQVVWNGTAISFYENATQIGTTNATALSGNTIGTSGLTEYDIGRYAAGAIGGKYCACFLDDFRWYNAPNPVIPPFTKMSQFLSFEYYSSPPPFEDMYDSLGKTCSTNQYLTQSFVDPTCAAIAQDYRNNMAFNVQFQNNTHDYISNINGTAHAAAGSVSYIKGVIGEAANFTKTNSQYFDYGNFAPANFGSNGFTVMAWFQTTCANAASCTIMSKGYTASATGWLLRVETNGHLGCGVQATGHSIEPTSSAAYNTGKPQFAICTWTPSTNTLTLYINGSSVATGTQSGIGSLTSTNFFQIGVDGASNFMSGYIADVRGYQFPFSATQVLNEWNFQSNLINGV